MIQKDKVTMWIDGDVHRRLKILAAKLGRTIQDCASEAIREWLEVQEMMQEHDDAHL